MLRGCVGVAVVIVQVISKRKLGTPEEVEDVKREVQIMHHLAGHKNVVALKNVYEDKSNVCLVMELCTGEARRWRGCMRAVEPCAGGKRRMTAAAGGRRSSKPQAAEGTGAPRTA